MNESLKDRVRTLRQSIKRNLRLKLGIELAHLGWFSSPAFLIIGAQKAGTVALFRYLSSHPDLTPAKSKEIRFFNRNKFYAKGKAWYHAHFPFPSRHHQIITYEATPEYLYYPNCAKRIYAYNPDLKLIVLLREPIERAFSAWNMYRSMFKERPQYLYARSRLANDDVRQAIDDMLSRENFPSFEATIQHEIEQLSSSVEKTPEPSYVRRGLYAEQLRRYFKYFPREQIWIGDSHYLKTHTPVILDQIVRFLGLPKHNWVKKQLPEHHVGSYKDRKIPEQTHALLRNFYAAHNQELYNLLGQDFGWM
jgi:hypothetical protein